MRISMAWILLGTGLLAGCASHMAPLSADSTALISGRETANLSSDEARRAVLIDGARITVDHGMQYFRVIDVSRTNAYGASGNRSSGITPGADITIKLYPSGSIRPNENDVWDAQRILTLGVPISTDAAVTEPQSSPQSYSRPAPSSAPRSAPRCTAYGCDW